MRSSSMIAGYWNEAELNSKCFVQIDGATFYRTGDIGEYLDNFIFSILSLTYFDLKDMILPLGILK